MSRVKWIKKTPGTLGQDLQLENDRTYVNTDMSSPYVVWGRASDAERTPISYNTPVVERLRWLGKLAGPIACQDFQNAVDSLGAAKKQLQNEKANLEKALAGAVAVGDEQMGVQLAAQLAEVNGILAKVNADLNTANASLANCNKIPDEPPTGPAPPPKTASSSGGGGWGILLLAASAAVAIFNS